METRDVNGAVLDSETFETKEELVEAFDKAVEDKEVKTIKVTKDKPKMTDVRKKVIDKQMRKLERKYNLLRKELQQG